MAEGVVEIEGEDDVEPLNKASNPRLPSAADVEEHNRTHTSPTGRGASGAWKAGDEASSTARVQDLPCPLWASITSS